MTVPDSPTPEASEKGLMPRLWQRLGPVVDSAFIWRTLVFLVAIVLLIVITTRWTIWAGDSRWQETDDAYLQSDLTPILAKVSGYVRTIPVQDFDHVRAGQLIADVVDDDYKASVAQGEANVAAAKAAIETFKAQIALQQANVAAANAVIESTSAQFDQNTRDVARQKQLLATGSSSTQDTEKLVTTRAQLEAQLSQNRAQALAANRQLLVLQSQTAQAEASLAAQQATLELARITLGYTRIVAPTDGVLSQRQVRPGQLVSVGSQITTLTPLPKVWVIANYRETQLTHIVVGEKAEIEVDTFPGHVLKGHVIAFAPGSGAQFSLLPPDNATGNFTKVVQRIAVKIAIDNPDGLADKLRPGMSVVASVDTRDDPR